MSPDARWWRRTPSVFQPQQPIDPSKVHYRFHYWHRAAAVACRALLLRGLITTSPVCGSICFIQDNESIIGSELWIDRSFFLSIFWFELDLVTRTTRQDWTANEIFGQARSTAHSTRNSAFRKRIKRTSDARDARVMPVKILRINQIPYPLQNKNRTVMLCGDSWVRFFLRKSSTIVREMNTHANIQSKLGKIQKKTNKSDRKWNGAAAIVALMSHKEIYCLTKCCAIKLDDFVKYNPQNHSVRLKERIERKKFC